MNRLERRGEPPACPSTPRHGAGAETMPLGGGPAAASAADSRGTSAALPPPGSARHGALPFAPTAGAPDAPAGEHLFWDRPLFLVGVSCRACAGAGCKTCRGRGSDGVRALLRCSTCNGVPLLAYLELLDRLKAEGRNVRLDGSPRWCLEEA